jgi:O-antigen ligase
VTVPERDSPVQPAIRWALGIFILSIPFEYPQRSLPWETSTITCALFLLAALLQPGISFRRFPGAAGWYGMFLYVVVISFVVNGGEYGDEVLRLLILLLQMALLLWAGYNVLRDEKVFRQAPFLLVVGCAARAALQLSGFGTTREPEWGGGERISWLGQNTNHSAMIMSAGLVALIGLAYARSGGQRRGRVLIWPIAAALGIAIIQNGSRGGVIALAFGLVTFALGGSGVRTRLRNVFVVVLTLGLLIWAGYNTEGMRNRFEQTASSGYMAGREQVYPELVQMFVERPILGYGFIANKYVLGGRLPGQHYTRRDAHNLLLEVMTATGIVGLVPFMAMLCLVWRAAWRARRGPDGILPLALLVTVLTANMSGNWVAGPLLWLTFAYALASDRASATAPGPVAADRGAFPVPSRRAFAWTAARQPARLRGATDGASTGPGR